MTILARLDWTMAAVALALVAAPLVAVAGPLAMAPLLIVTGCMAGIGLWRARVMPRWRDPVVVTLGALMLWAIVSTAWALDPGQAFYGSVKLALNAALGLALVTAAGLCQPGRLALPALVAGGLVVAALLVEYGTGLGISYWVKSLQGHSEHLGKSSMNRGAAVMSFLCWPILALIQRRFGIRTAVLGLLAVAAGVLISDNSSAKIAFLLGAAVAVAAALPFLRTSRILQVALVGLVLAAPLLAQQLPTPQDSFVRWPSLPTSMHHRLTIWKFAAERTAEHPLIGWGFDAARSIPGGEDTVTLPRQINGVIRPLIEQHMPLHPHNAAMHVWIELGLLGALLFSTTLWLLIARCQRITLPGPAGPASLATIAAAFVVANMSFGLWQSWWQASLWMAAAACASLTANRGEAP